MTTLLAVDVGNTNTVLGVFRDGELAAHWRIQTIAQRTSDEYAVQLKKSARSTDLLDALNAKSQVIGAEIK